MKNNHPKRTRNLTLHPIPSRPQDEPFWISIGGCLTFVVILFLGWSWI